MAMTLKLVKEGLGLSGGQKQRISIAESSFKKSSNINTR